MRTFYERWKYKHVDEAAFREVAEEVSGMDLATFFAQGLHGTALVDYAVGRVKSGRTGRSGRSGRSGGQDGQDGQVGQVGHAEGWTTRVEVLRKAEGRLPVEVWVIGDKDTAMVRTDGLAEREWVTVSTRSKPKQVLLDPRLRTRDWNMLNNTGAGDCSGRYEDQRPSSTWIPGSARRPRGTGGPKGWLPTAWYNDAAGITLGIRSREDYFGRFEKNLTLLSYGTGWESDLDVKDADFLSGCRTRSRSRPRASRRRSRPTTSKGASGLGSGWSTPPTITSSGAR